MVQITLTDSQRVKLQIGDPLDARGNKTSVDGAITVASSDESLVSVTPHDSGEANTYWVTAAGPLTSAAIVTVSADADPSAGVDQIVMNIAVEVTAGKAASFATSVGTPEEVPAP